MSARYPELDKVAAIPDAERQTLGTFIEWLAAQGLHLCRYREAGNNGKRRRIPATQEQLDLIRLKDGPYSFHLFEAESYGVENPEFESWEAGYYPDFPYRLSDPQALMAPFYGIDLHQVAREQAALLFAVREEAEQDAAQHADERDRPRDPGSTDSRPAD